VCSFPCKALSANLEIRRNLDNDSKYLIPTTSRVHDGLCGFSRIVHELVPLPLSTFADTMQAHNCLSLIIPCIESSPWTLSAALSLLLKDTPAILTHLPQKTPTSPALYNSLGADNTHPTVKRQWQNLFSLKKKAWLNNLVCSIFHQRICFFHLNLLCCSSCLCHDAVNPPTSRLILWLAPPQGTHHYDIFQLHTHSSHIHHLRWPTTFTPCPGSHRFRADHYRVSGQLPPPFRRRQCDGIDGPMELPMLLHSRSSWGEATTFVDASCHCTRWVGEGLYSKLLYHCCAHLVGDWLAVCRFLCPWQISWLQIIIKWGEFMYAPWYLLLLINDSSVEW